MKSIYTIILQPCEGSLHPPPPRQQHKYVLITKTYARCAKSLFSAFYFLARIVSSRNAFLHCFHRLPKFIYWQLLQPSARRFYPLRPAVSLVKSCLTSPTNHYRSNDTNTPKLAPIFHILWAKIAPKTLN